MNVYQKAYTVAWRRLHVRLVLLSLMTLSSLGFAQSTYDAGFLATGKIQLCGYNGQCSDTGGTFASDKAVNDGVGFIKITNAANPLGVTLNIGHPTMPTPSGWTPGAGGGFPTPPATAGAPTTVRYYWITVGGLGHAIYTDPLAAYQAGYAAAGSPQPTASVAPNTGQCSGDLVNVLYCGSPTNSNITKNDVATCPAGYTNTSGTCTLSNANLVPYPAAQDCVIQRSGNTFSYDSRNPGCDTSGGANTPAKAANVSASGSTATASGSGKGVTVTVAADGSVTIEVAVPSATGAGTVTKQYKTGPTPTGTGGTGTDTPITGTAVGLSAGVGTLAGTGGSTTTQDCGGVPCATEATLSQIKNNVASGVKQDEQGAAWSTERTGVGSASTTSKATLDSLTSKGTAASASGQGADLNSGLGNLSLPSTAPSQVSFWSSWFPAPASCAPIALASSGRFSGLSMDMCPVINVFKTVIEWGLYILTALVIYQSWFGGARAKQQEMF